MTQEKQTWNVLTKKVKKNINVRATDTELLARGQAAAELATEQAKLEEEKKLSADDYKSKIDTAKGKLSGVLDEIRTQKINVMNAECVEVFDVESGTYRLMWGERVVEERTMQVDERTKYQSNIFEMRKQEAQKATDEAFAENTIEAEFASSNDVRAVIASETNRKTKKGACP